MFGEKSKVCTDWSVSVDRCLEVNLAAPRDSHGKSGYLACIMTSETGLMSSVWTSEVNDM